MYLYKRQHVCFFVPQNELFFHGMLEYKSLLIQQEVWNIFTNTLYLSTFIVISNLLTYWLIIISMRRYFKWTHHFLFIHEYTFSQCPICVGCRFWIDKTVRGWERIFTYSFGGNIWIHATGVSFLLVQYLVDNRMLSILFLWNFASSLVVFIVRRIKVTGGAIKILFYNGNSNLADWSFRS